MTAGWRRRLGLVNGLQTAGIGLAILLLVRLGQASRLIPSAVCAIVGVHFFPLARIFGERFYTWTGAFSCAMSVGGMVVVADDGRAGLPRGRPRLGAAATLWATSLWLSRPTGTHGADTHGRRGIAPPWASNRALRAAVTMSDEQRLRRAGVRRGECQRPARRGESRSPVRLLAGRSRRAPRRSARSSAGRR